MIPIKQFPPAQASNNQVFHHAQNFSLPLFLTGGGGSMTPSNFAAFVDPLTVRYIEIFHTDFSYLSIYSKNIQKIIFIRGGEGYPTFSPLKSDPTKMTPPDCMQPLFLISEFYSTITSTILGQEFWGSCQMMVNWSWQGGLSFMCFFYLISQSSSFYIIQYSIPFVVFLNKELWFMQKQEMEL